MKTNISIRKQGAMLEPYVSPTVAIVATRPINMLAGTLETDIGGDSTDSYLSKENVAWEDGWWDEEIAADESEDWTGTPTW